MCILDEKELMKQALNKALSIAGGQTALAKIAKVKPQAVQQWVKQGYVSRRSAKIVSRGTGVPLEEL